jgi:hypothetical protein
MFRMRRPPHPAGRPGRVTTAGTVSAAPMEAATPRVTAALAAVTARFSERSDEARGDFCRKIQFFPLRRRVRRVVVWSRPVEVFEAGGGHSGHESDSRRGRAGRVVTARGRDSAVMTRSRERAVTARDHDVIVAVTTRSRERVVTTRGHDVAVTTNVWSRHKA